jgi:predicted MPP superfamily phosphohydrolase
MRMFHLILFGIPLLSLAYWVWGHRRLRRVGSRSAAHIAFAISMALPLVGFVWVVLARSNQVATQVPSWLYAVVLIWALVALPFLALPVMISCSILTTARKLRDRMCEREGADPASPGGEILTRRQVLGTAALAVPMIATFGATAASMPQRNHFRVRNLTIRLRELPAALDGIRIAHVSDTHVGKFTRGKILHALADATSRLEADLVLLTGDLIDHSIDDLPEALDMVQRMRARSGLFTIEGNHDLFEGVEPFVEGVRGRGIPLLRDESTILQIRGRPVQLMGLAWHGRGGSIEAGVDRVADQRDPDAFPILLAHHPHAFDRAAERGIPLTLAGHTHGGQIMLTPEIGPGPMMFKYWSGEYRKASSGHSLVVSNGAGNWFPLRTCAPAEIIHLTLRRA